jgi:hypothetical protein
VFGVWNRSTQEIKCRDLVVIQTVHSKRTIQRELRQTARKFFERRLTEQLGNSTEFCTDVCRVIASFAKNG